MSDSPAPKRRKTASRPPFVEGEEVETYIGGARVTGVVVRYVPGKPRRHPVIVERGTGMLDGWVRVEEGRPGKVTFKTHAHEQEVTRTTLFVGNLTRGERLEVPVTRRERAEAEA